MDNKLIKSLRILFLLLLIMVSVLGIYLNALASPPRIWMISLFGLMLTSGVFQLLAIYMGEDE